MTTTHALLRTSILAVSAMFMLNGCSTTDSPRRFVDAYPCAAPQSWSFDDDAPNAVPESWIIAETNSTGAPATWSIVSDPTAPSPPHAFALTSTSNSRYTYNLAICDQSWYRDLELTVHVNGLTGSEDQGGGPIWRCIDENNYYICRFNPLEANYRVYVVKDGERTQLKSASVNLKADRWYALRITMVGPHIACWLGGELLLTVEDHTFTDPGHIGFWTKADAVTSFDNLTAKTICADP